jgi:putative membrane-bound dehydrogenase-like protein
MLPTTGTGYAIALLLLMFQGGTTLLGEIEFATDGPKPLSPEESARSFQVPDGFHVDLVAAEPLIQEPSGVCWDADGRMYVSELHGYNLEGQYDIDALNKSGKLDRVVRRIQANEQAKKDAEAGTYGVIKQLTDEDGDGRMDRASVFAEGLPPCFGMVPSRKGIIVVCAPHIYYLADLDSDGIADVRERLFTGFQEGVLERRINAPQWGLDNWIYIGGGGRADQITGPYLKGSVALGRTDFRIRPDGSAIEPVAGSTGTFGHTFTAAGDRLTISTGTPGYQVIPLPWRYLGRNAELSIPSVERNAANYQSTYPVAAPHPWRTRRANDPGFSKYYTDHYGKAESTPSGFFTSACSPFIYRDVAFPEAYRGHNFSCEPAQNLIHHSVPQWEGVELRLIKGGNIPEPESVRAWAMSEQGRKLPNLPIASVWQQLGPLLGEDKNTLFEKHFSPEKAIDFQGHLDGKRWEDKHHYKDGKIIDLGLPENAAIYLRRILTCDEDVSIHLSLGSNDAIKCWLNGVLLLENNVNRGAAADQEFATLNLKKGDNTFLMKIVNGTNTSGFYFEMRASLIPDSVREVLKVVAKDWTAVQFSVLEKHYQTLQAGRSKREFLASTDQWFHPMNLTHGPDGAVYITDFYREIIEDYSAIPRYLQQQYGLTNGMHHGRIWRLSHEEAPETPVIRMSHLFNTQLVADVGSPHAWRRETARRLLIERGADDMQTLLMGHLEKDRSPEASINALYTLQGLKVLGQGALRSALSHPHWSVQRHALQVGDAFPVHSPQALAVSEWLSEISHYGSEPRLLLQMALSLGSFRTPGALDALAYLSLQHGKLRWMNLAIASSVYLREEGLLARLLVERRDGSELAELLAEMLASRGNDIQIRKAKASVQYLAKRPQRELYSRILDAGLQDTRDRLERFALEAPEPPDATALRSIEERLPLYLSALESKVDPVEGKALFIEHCASCHQAAGLGRVAGPNLDSEFQRAPETIARDILFPNASITEGFETIHLEMRQGADVMGLMAGESPTSISLRFPGGEQFTFLKKHIERVRTHKVSLMPAQFAHILQPEELAAIVAFIRQTGR